MKIHDRIESRRDAAEEQPRPPADENCRGDRSRCASRSSTAEQAAIAGEGRTGLRRLTRAEYENTVRDLFDLPGIALQGDLPADGSAHGFDKNSDALDISHVNLAKYVEAADRTLDLAIATQPKPPTVQKQRHLAGQPGGFVAHVLMNGDGVLLKNKKPDPDFPPAGEHEPPRPGRARADGLVPQRQQRRAVPARGRIVQPVLQRVRRRSIPGRYRVRTSLWSFQWDKGKVLPSRGTEAARLSVVQLTGDGRGGGASELRARLLRRPVARADRSTSSSPG